MTNYSRVTIYNHYGQSIFELHTRTRRSWLRNDIGSATLWISPKDAKYSEKLLRLGNLVMIEHDTMPRWVGEFCAPQIYNEGEIQIEARSAEAKLQSRIIPRRTRYQGNTASIVGKLLDDCNSQGDTLLRAGDLVDANKVKSFRAGMLTGLDVMNKVVDRTGLEWWVDPLLTSEDRLLLQLSLSSQRGVRYPEYPCLIEGQNIEAGRRPLMSIEGDVANHVIAISRGVADGGSIIQEIEDPESIENYGRFSVVVDSDGDDVEGVVSDAADHLAQYKNGKRIFNPVAINKNDLFAYLRIGTVLPVQLSSIGFDDGQLGIDTMVKITGMAYDDLENTCPLTVEETS